jgi:hypothetical protein
MATGQIRKMKRFCILCKFLYHFLQYFRLFLGESNVVPFMEVETGHIPFHVFLTFIEDDPDIRKQAYVLWFSIVAWLLPSLISAIFYYKVCSTVWKSRFWGHSDDDNLKTATAPSQPLMGESTGLTTNRAMR